MGERIKNEINEVGKEKKAWSSKCPKNEEKKEWTRKGKGKIGERKGKESTP